MLESLVCAGAFDSMKPAAQTLHHWRACLFASVDRALEGGSRTRRERDSGQVAMFGFVAGGAAEESNAPTHMFATAEAWAPKDLLTREKAAVGFYVSGHPMQDFAERIEQLGCASVADLSGAAPDARLRLAGVVSDFTVRNTKKGDRYAFFRLEDMTGVSVKCVLWPEALKTKGGDAADDRVVLAVGRIDGSGEGSVTLVCDEVMLLEKARVPAHVPAAGFRNGRNAGKALVIEMPASSADLATLCDSVTQALVSNPGDCEVFIEMNLPDGLLVRARTNRLIKVFPSQKLQDALASTGARIRWADAGSMN